MNGVNVARALLPWAFAVALGIVTYLHHEDMRRLLKAECEVLWTDPVCSNAGFTHYRSVN